MNSGKIGADGTGRDGTGEIEGSTRGPRGPKNGQTAKAIKALPVPKGVETRFADGA